MSKYSSNLAFIDLLFNLLLVFVCLFLLSFILINPKQDTGKIDSNAEFLITLTWDDYSIDDIDLWVADPAGNIVSFVQQEAGLMHLDRDDRGEISETVTTENGTVASLKNQEIVTVRGYVPGEYVVNVHMYAKRTDQSTSGLVQILKLNPYSVICEKPLMMSLHGDEETICRFSIDSNGKVTSTNELPKRLLRY